MLKQANVLLRYLLNAHMLLPQQSLVCVLDLKMTFRLSAQGVSYTARNACRRFDSYGFMFQQSVDCRA